MDASAAAGVERVDARADLGGLLPDGGGREPAALLAVLGAVGGAVELVGEVEPRGAAAEVEHGRVVGARGGDGGGVGPEPDPRPLVGLADLRHPLAPLAHPHAAVLPASSPTDAARVPACSRGSFHGCRRGRRGLRRGVEGGGVPLHARIRLGGGRVPLWVCVGCVLLVELPLVSSPLYGLWGWYK
jgi:hypothetical protein